MVFIFPLSFSFSRPFEVFTKRRDLLSLSLLFIYANKEVQLIFIYCIKTGYKFDAWALTAWLGQLQFLICFFSLQALFYILYYVFIGKDQNLLFSHLLSGRHRGGFPKLLSQLKAPFPSHFFMGQQGQSHSSHAFPTHSHGSTQTPP